jgi:uncharacterized membrane-anchored protein YhcB (DUF1043 family)
MIDELAVFGLAALIGAVVGTAVAWLVQIPARRRHKREMYVLEQMLQAMQEARRELQKRLADEHEQIADLAEQEARLRGRVRE